MTRHRNKGQRCGRWGQLRWELRKVVALVKHVCVGVWTMLGKWGDGTNFADGDSCKPVALGSHLRLIRFQKLRLSALKIWKILCKNLDLQKLLK